MSDSESNILYFLKDEASLSCNDGDVTNYVGAGARFDISDGGSVEGMLAFKNNGSSIGSFAELKATTPKSNDIAFETRVRFNVGNEIPSFASRLALKYSKELNKNCSIYEIMGASIKIDTQGENTSVTPLSLTGFQYKPTKNLSLYAEGEISKRYNTDECSWNKFSPVIYLGTRLTF